MLATIELKTLLQENGTEYGFLNHPFQPDLEIYFIELILESSLELLRLPPDRAKTSIPRHALGVAVKLLGNQHNVEAIEYIKNKLALTAEVLRRKVISVNPKVRVQLLGFSSSVVFIEAFQPNQELSQYDHVKNLLICAQDSIPDGCTHSTHL